MRNSDRRPVPAALLNWMLFDAESWSRRRRGGRDAFIRRMTSIGWLAFAVVLLSLVARSHRTGVPIASLLDEQTLVMVAFAALLPIFLRLLAPLEWMLLETRYGREIAKANGQPLHPVTSG